MLNIKTKETFQYEVKRIMDEFDMNTLEAMAYYGQRYGLDPEYIVENLLSPGLKASLQEECEAKHMVKRSLTKIDGI